MKNHDYTITKRQAAHTARLIEQGGRRVTLRLSPELAQRVDAERERTGESTQALILRLLQNNLP